LGDRKWAQLLLFPPGFLIAAGMKLAMVQIAQGDGKLIAHFASQSLGLSEAQMMGMDGLASTDETRKPGNIAEMPWIPEALHLTSK
jgi:hypothetical protein